MLALRLAGQAPSLGQDTPGELESFGVAGEFEVVDGPSSEPGELRMPTCMMSKRTDLDDSAEDWTQHKPTWG